MKRTDIDVELAGYLKSVPPEHQEELAAAMKLIMASQKRGSWTRSLVIAGAALFGSGVSMQSYLSNLATKGDISRLEAQYAAVAREAFDREERQNDRISHLEGAIRGMRVTP